MLLHFVVGPLLARPRLLSQRRANMRRQQEGEPASSGAGSAAASSRDADVLLDFLRGSALLLPKSKSKFTVYFVHVHVPFTSET